MWIFVTVLVVTAVVDAAWVAYFLYSNARKSIKAGLISAFIAMSGPFVSEKYINDHALLAAVGLGAFIGTVITIHFFDPLDKTKSTS